MTNVFIIHGTGGHPEENWFPWLKKELETLGCKVIIPQFPTPENQTPETWFAVFDKYKEHFTSDTILIAHSLGGAFALRILERSKITIKAAFFVGTPVGVRPIKNWDGDLPFIGKPFDWNKIKSHTHRSIVFHSNNDPYVSLGNGELLAEKLDVQLTFIKNAGHFNRTSGYEKFEELLKKVKIEL
ncbi:MAG: alpha/beta fold hydrolase [Candidatus Micrarchaeota archaeon]|nr:alpha/beta fold hydrolase [Candidatus Micrarchaeota archaeon]